MSRNVGSSSAHGSALSAFHAAPTFSRARLAASGQLLALPPPGGITSPMVKIWQNFTRKGRNLLPHERRGYGFESVWWVKDGAG